MYSGGQVRAESIGNLASNVLIIGSSILWAFCHVMEMQKGGQT